MKVAVVEFDSSGGLLHYAYQFCSALAEEGVEVTLFTGSEYELRDLPHNFHLEANLKLWPLFDPKAMKQTSDNPLTGIIRKALWTLRRAKRAIRLIKAWQSLTTTLIDLRPDIIQFSEIHFPFESIFLARLRRENLTLAQVCHEFERRESRGFWKKMTEKAFAGTFRHFSTIFFLAEKSRERFLSLYPYPWPQTHVIPHGNESVLLKAAAILADGENLRHRYGLAESDHVVLFFGTLSPSKGLPDLIEAFRIVSKHSTAKLVIAGFPTRHIEINELKRQAAQANLSERVIFDTRYLPFASVGRLMELATVVVFPYINATQSGALQAAYAFGKPVVATSVGGLPEVVLEGKSGYLVPPRRPDLLAERILHLLNTPGLSTEMGLYAAHLSENHFGWGTIARQVVEVYQKLLTS